MFGISNAIAYDNLMVYGTPERRALPLIDSCWIDVRSPSGSRGHWIEKEGHAARQILDYLRASGIPSDEIMLLSPFRDGARQLSTLGRSTGISCCGTIHTAQGKERDVVLLVLGGNPEKPGAKIWASSRPNLLNVAVSRARRRLFVIGDFDAWRSFPFFSVCASKLSRCEPDRFSDS